MNKKVLVLSTNAISDYDSNGKTIKNLLINVPDENIYQLYLKGTPGNNYSCNFFNIYKGQFRNPPLSKFKSYNTENRLSFFSKISSFINFKLPIFFLFREYFYNCFFWKTHKLINFIKEIKPDLLLLFISNNTLLIRITIFISKTFNIPIVLYTSEDYYFKVSNYMSSNPSIFYKEYFKILIKYYKLIEPLVSFCILNTFELMEKYKEEFSFSCTFIHNISTVDFIPNIAIYPNMVVTYVGNLGVGRLHSLIEISNKLQEISNGLTINVYGPLPRTPNDIYLLHNTKGLLYKGFADKEKYLSLLRSSNLLIHTETSNPNKVNELAYSFSTKIADFICSGTPFLLYAPKEFVISNFVTKYKCGFYANNLNNLKQNLINALTNLDQRAEVVNKCKNLSETYFRKSDKFNYQLNNYIWKSKI